MEVWKKIEGYEKYFISNYGRVKAVDKKYKGEHIHGLRLTQDGYSKVALRQNEKSKEYRMHRLVATHFIENPHGYETVNHKDGNKLNNKCENLEWMNRSQQLKHAYDLGLKKPAKGELNSNAVLTNSQALKIRNEYVKFSKEFGTIALGEKYNVNPSVIQDIISNKTYK